MSGPKVSVLIPYREDSPERAKLLDQVLRWWRRRYPEYELSIGTDTDDSSAPWRKALAYEDALQGATGHILILTDCDVLVPTVHWAVDQVYWFKRVWARGHSKVVRLTSQATSELLQLHLQDAVAFQMSLEPACWEQWAYTQQAAGAGTVVARKAYEQVPIDPRFEGWGCEDEAWGLAMQLLFPEGPPATGPCVHLWHPPQPRELRGGSEPSQALLRRYRQAWHARDAKAMWSLLREFSPGMVGDDSAHP